MRGFDGKIKIMKTLQEIQKRLQKIQERLAETNFSIEDLEKVEKENRKINWIIQHG